MIQTTSTAICERNGRTEGTCTVIFEAPTLKELGSSLQEWVTEHPHHRPLSFSHAQETRWDPASASLSGPRPFSVYTGILVVRPTSPTIGQEAEKAPSLYEPLPV
jgi:hypothetical protein